MREPNTKNTRLGCFGMFTCINDLICKDCYLYTKCKEIAKEREEKLKKILKVKK